MARTLPVRLRTITAAVVVIASGLLIWNAYQSIIGSTDITTATLPIIAADTQPFRVLPENPGGAEIPNQGSTLYNVLNSENSDRMALDGVTIPADEGEPDNLFEQDNFDTNSGFELPELPERRTESLYGMMDELKNDTMAAVEDDIENNAEPMETDEKNALKEKLKAAIEKVEVNAAEDEPIEDEILVIDPDVKAKIDTETDIETAATIITPARKPAYSRPVTLKTEAKTITEKPKQEFSLETILSTPPTQKRYYIQLASVKGEDNAREAYARIRDDFPKLVEGVSVSFPQADMGSRGIFTRIQVGPMDAKDARARCAEYTSSRRGGTCLVLSR